MVFLVSVCMSPKITRVISSFASAVNEDSLRILSFNMCHCCSSGQEETDDVQTQETRRQRDCIDKELRAPNIFHRRELKIC
jgi:hypothetical protein